MLNSRRPCLIHIIIMKEDIQKLLRTLTVFSNDHPNNDERLFDIVLETVGDPIGQDEFKEVVGDMLYERYFATYEKLIAFVKYLRKHEKNNC